MSDDARRRRWSLGDLPLLVGAGRFVFFVSPPLMRWLSSLDLPQVSETASMISSAAIFLALVGLALLGGWRRLVGTLVLATAGVPWLLICAASGFLAGSAWSITQRGAPPGIAAVVLLGVWLAIADVRRRAPGPKTEQVDA